MKVNKYKSMNGFSLLEIALTIAAILLFSTLSIGSLTSLQTTFKLRGAADEMKSLLAQGRELAIANKNKSTYSIALSNTELKLMASGSEINRYQIPSKITTAPPSFDWNFASTSGVIAGCAPCQITLSSGESTEIIIIQENGAVY